MSGRRRTCGSWPAPVGAWRALSNLTSPPATAATALAAAGEDKGKGPKQEEEGEGGLDDDTLKCAICFDLCVRPVTVSLTASVRAPAAASTRHQYIRADEHVARRQPQPQPASLPSPLCSGTPFCQLVIGPANWALPAPALLLLLPCRRPASTTSA